VAFNLSACTAFFLLAQRPYRSLFDRTAISFAGTRKRE
jgi:hypothetical protein